MKTAILVLTVLFLCGSSFGQTYKVLWNFGSAVNDGLQPVGALVADQNGNLYGATAFGGEFGGGTIFQLQPQPSGSWTESIIYNFCSVIVNRICADGQEPQAGLALDPLGNLYGTTYAGGDECTFTGGGCGTVFRLAPPSGAGGTWTESVLYAFCSQEGQQGCEDGSFPMSQLALDAAGNLYGTTTQGGMGHWTQNNGAGTAFEVSPGAGGWTGKTLYNFCSLGSGTSCPDGAQPLGGVTLDAAGNLYGTTYRGGGGGLAYGIVYELASNAGAWTETILSTFYKRVGANAPVRFDRAGNLYSTTEFGETGAGSVFRLAQDRSMRSLSFNSTDGNEPMAGVIVDPRNGNLYGTTEQGGSGYGNAFELTKSGKLTTLYSFCSQPNCTDGELPASGLLGLPPGVLYGTTPSGGANGAGVVFEIAP